MGNHQSLRCTCKRKDRNENERVESLSTLDDRFEDKTSEELKELILQEIKDKQSKKKIEIETRLDEDMVVIDESGEKSLRI